MKTPWTHRKQTDDAPTWKPQWMRRTHRPRGFYQLDRITGQVTMRIRPQRGPGAGHTIVMWTSPNITARHPVSVSVDGYPQLVQWRSFFACYSQTIARLAHVQGVASA